MHLELHWDSWFFHIFDDPGTGLNSATKARFSQKCAHITRQWSGADPNGCEFILSDYSAQFLRFCRQKSHGV